MSKKRFYYTLYFHDDILCKSYGRNKKNRLILLQSVRRAKPKKSPLPFANTITVTTPEELLENIERKATMLFVVHEKRTELSLFLRKLLPMIKDYKQMEIKIEVISTQEPQRTVYEGIDAYLKGLNPPAKNPVKDSTVKGSVKGSPATVKDSPATVEDSKKPVEDSKNCVIFPIQQYNTCLSGMPENDYFFIGIKKGTKTVIPPNLREITGENIVDVESKDVLSHLCPCKAFYIIDVEEELTSEIKEYAKEHSIPVFLDFSETITEEAGSTAEEKSETSPTGEVTKETNSTEKENPTGEVNPTKEVSSTGEINDELDSIEDVFRFNEQELKIYKRKLMQAYRNRIFLFLQSTGRVNEEAEDAVKEEVMDLTTLIVRYPKGTNWQEKMGEFKESLKTHYEPMYKVIQCLNHVQLGYLWELCFHFYVTSAQLYGRDKFNIQKDTNTLKEGDGNNESRKTKTNAKP